MLISSSAVFVFLSPLHALISLLVSIYHLTVTSVISVFLLMAPPACLFIDILKKTNVKHCGARNLSAAHLFSSENRTKLDIVLMCQQILINNLKKCMEISKENLYFDFGSERINLKHWIETQHLKELLHGFRISKSLV